MKPKHFTFVLASGSFSLLFTLVLILLLSIYAPDVQAASPTKGMPKDDHWVQTEITVTLPYTLFVPLALKGEVSSLPILISPVDGSKLDTLIPHFVFETGTAPDNSAGVLDFSTDPDPNRNDWNGSFGLQSDEHWDWVAWYNLEPNTTYYWRVGVIENYDYDKPPKWTQQWSFTTGPAGGTMLPAPTLTFPANNSSIPANQAILKWEAVPGAVEYGMTVHDIDDESWYGWEITETQVDLYNDSELIRAGGHYEWYVEARNDYAWGTASPMWKFNISSAANSPQPQAVSPAGMVRVHKDGKWVLIAK